jgi:enoyl-CoA hydratase/carnithine racemase
MNILVESKFRVLHLTLNRPEKRNALNAEMCTSMVREIENAQTRNDIGCVLISARGHVFCSGMDLDEAASTSKDELADIHERLFSLGAHSTKPIVVCVNGSALGGGLGLVAQGHVVLAGQGCGFALPEVRVGLWPFLIYRSIEAALGSRRALELSLTGRVFHSQEAQLWGLVHHVGPGAEILDRAKVTARDLAKSSPKAIRAGMQYVAEACGKSWVEKGEIAMRLRAELIAGADFQEGYEAFKQKREPHWPSIPRDFYEPTAATSDD